MNIAHRISGYNRKRKWQLFQEVIGVHPNQTILDVGFTDREFSPYDNFIEKNYPYPEKITALGIDKPYVFQKNYPNIKVVIYDGKHFPFCNSSFDLVWSNAVIEHVGSREDQLSFLKEIKRVGKKAFITTPNKNFLFEVHTRIPLLHLLFKKQKYDKFLVFIGKGWATGDYMNLLSMKDIIALLAEASIFPYRIFRNKIFGLTLDYVIIF